MIAAPDPDDPDGLEVLRRFAQRNVPDEWAPSRDSWLVACLIEARLCEEFWLRDDSPRGFANATYTRYVFGRVPHDERDRRQLQRQNGWNETPAERERWLRERRRREPANDAVALYVCELAPLAALLVLSKPDIASTEQDETALHQLVDIAMAELRGAGWQVVDEALHRKLLPTELGGHRVFDVVFAICD